jgi:hypothetical protein
MPNETFTGETKEMLTEETHEPLGHFDFEEPSEGAKRDSWVLTAAAGTCVAMAALPAALIYQSFRDGTNFWFWFVLALVVLGGGFAALGSWMRRRGDVPQNSRIESWILSAAGKP